MAFYTPESRWGGGLIGVHNFFLDSTDKVSPASQVQFGLTFTQNKQFLAYVPFNLFWEERKWQASGQLGWYNYNYFFYGVGNDLPEDFEEYYAVNFPRFRLQFTRNLKGPWYIGGRIWADAFDIPRSELDTSGLLIQEIIPGSDGGRVHGGGLKIAYDTRDNVYSSTKGAFVELVVQDHSNYWLSEYTFSKYRFEAKAFKKIKNTVVAAQLLTIQTTGNVPFNHMGYVGGSFINRGYYEGRYRDKSMLSGQVEVRFDIYRKFSGVAFGSVGVVGGAPQELAFNNSRFAGGGGVRYDLDEKKGVKIRLDYALGKESTGFYLTFGEAF